MFAVLVRGTAAEPADAEPSVDKVPSSKDLSGFRKTIETLRGKNFIRDVPAYDISEKELRAIVDRELAKEYPGEKLTNYQELMIWLDVLPRATEIQRVLTDLFVDQVAGLYNSETKEMCIPREPGAKKGPKKPAEKKLQELAAFTQAMVLTHEYTHALEDQYWPMDDPEEEDRQESTDREMARTFLFEGSATRMMIEAIPAQSWPGAESYIRTWNLLHSGLIEAVLDYELGKVWKSSEAKVEGVPETLSRAEAMPYSYGYTFCRRVVSQWGLDGLDYIYDHQPVSTEQVMHSEKAWEWHDFPVSIRLPDTNFAGWKQLTGESLGEAGISILFGAQLKSLNRGSRIARGWDGDRVALYEGPNGRRALLWASAWDSLSAARRFAAACAEERQGIRKARITVSTATRTDWRCPDGATGMVLCEGKRVLFLESDTAEGFGENTAWVKAVTFTDPPEEAARAQVNHALIRFNPLFSQRKDEGYVVNSALGGLLWRHDRNSVGKADRVLVGVLGESRRTASFRKWEIGRGFVAKHESEARRGFSKTTLLPWGVLYSHMSAAFPQNRSNIIVHTSVLWGWGGSHTQNGSDHSTVKLLPWGLLFRRSTGPGRKSMHVLATGVSRQEPGPALRGSSSFRLLGIPVWKSYTPPRFQDSAANPL